VLAGIDPRAGPVGRRRSGADVEVDDVRADGRQRPAGLQGGDHRGRHVGDLGVALRREHPQVGVGVVDAAADPPGQQAGRALADQFRAEPGLFDPRGELRQALCVAVGAVHRRAPCQPGGLAPAVALTETACIHFLPTRGCDGCPESQRSNSSERSPSADRFKPPHGRVRLC
jgi:hypothetical protein